MRDFRQFRNHFTAEEGSEVINRSIKNWHEKKSQALLTHGLFKENKTAAESKTDVLESEQKIGPYTK